MTSSSQVQKQQQQEQESEQQQYGNLQQSLACKHKLLLTDPDNRSIDALMFVVPGMGSRSNLVQQLEEQFKPSKLAHGLVKWWDGTQVSQILLDNLKESMSMNGVSSHNVALCTIDYQMITREKIQFDDTLASITLPTVQYLRNMGNNTAIDVLMYCSGNDVKNSTLEVVRRVMCDVYEEVVARHPQVRDSVYIVGHSLGSVISFDLLHEMEAAQTGEGRIDGASDQLLPFQPKGLFMLGSPLGLFLLLRQGFRPGKPFETRQNLLLRTPMYSLYHPLDPVAYRIEPLIDKRFTEVPPVKVPVAKESTVDKISSKITHFWMNLKQSTKNNNNSNGKASIVEVEADEIDIEVQQSSQGPQQEQQQQQQQNIFESFFSTVNMAFNPQIDTSAVETRTEETIIRTADIDNSDNGSRNNSPREWMSQYHRIDYELSTPSSLNMMINPYVMSGLSHLTYWSMRDVGHFIVNHVAFVGKKDTVSTSASSSDGGAQSDKSG